MRLHKTMEQHVQPCQTCAKECVKRVKLRIVGCGLVDRTHWCACHGHANACNAESGMARRPDSVVSIAFAVKWFYGRQAGMLV